MPDQRYDALLFLSFGGPETHGDVIPFLENVLRGRNVPRERMLEVAEHYYHFDGKSPINDQCREMIAELKEEFGANGVNLPIYWGNRNWHPMVNDTVRQMVDDGVKRALVYVTSAFSSYSGCRQYREDMAAAIESVQGALELEKIPSYFDHPGFISTMVERVEEGLAALPGAGVVYTAHSIPVSMAATSPYVGQLTYAAGKVNEALGLGEVKLLYQSRSGPPTQPWLEPDICDYIRSTEAKKLIVVPIGFLSDHMEVMYDLDTEAAEAAAERGIEFFRAKTVGVHPHFVRAVREMVQDALANGITPICKVDCCQPARRPGGPPQLVRPA